MYSVHSNSRFNVLLKIVAALLAATLYLAETATPQFREQRLIPLEVPRADTLKHPENYRNTRIDRNSEISKGKNQVLPSDSDKKFVVYGRAATHERAGIAFRVEYRPIIRAREPEFIPHTPFNTTFRGEPNTSRMPDLEGFFDFGGTVELLTTDTTLKKYDIVMSELMWGIDTGLSNTARSTITIPAGTPPNNTNASITVTVPQLVNQEVQWIELYNTKNEYITAKLYLLFTPFESYPDRNEVQVEIDSTPTDCIVLDAVSTLLFGKWQLPGKSGRRPRTTLVSAYRNIDYEIVENKNLSREAQLAGIPFGSYKESWEATPDTGRRNVALRIFVNSNLVELPYLATPVKSTSTKST